MVKSILLLGLLFFCIMAFAQNYDAELISQKTTVEVSNNKLIKNRYFEIKINNRAGEKYTKIAIPYSKIVKVSNVEAYIKDANGKLVRKLKKNDIVERSSIADFSFYEDDFVKEFNMKHNSYPYTIVYSYQVQQSEFLYIDYWTPVIDEKIPTLSAQLIVSVPFDYSITYKSQFVEKSMTDTLENSIEYRWETSYKDIVEDEKYSPPINGFLPSVEIVPIEFSYAQKGSLKNWQSFGNWQCKLLEGLNELPDIEKNRIDELIKNEESEKDKIRKLYHYMQDETRYINVTIETGGLKPYPASYVAKNKYGDCKALTNYFKSVLDYVQIPSFYTKVYAGNPIKKIDKSFTSQQFNHIILYVPLRNEDIWLDCTSDGAFNYLGTFTQNRSAFIVEKGNSRFVNTPKLTASEVLVVRRIQVGYSPDKAIVKFTNTYKGDSYEDILHLEKDYRESDKNRILRNYIIESGFQLGDYHISNLDRDSVAIELSYDATSQGIYKQYGNDILLKSIAFRIPQLERPQERKLPVQIDFPIYKIDTVVYEIPTGYKLNVDTNAYSIANKYGEYNLHIYEDEGNITIIKSLLVNVGYYSLSEYKDFYDFYSQIIGIENKTHLSLSK